MIGAAQLLDELPLFREPLRGGSGEPVLRAHVDCDEIAVRALRDAGGPAHEPIAVRGSGQGHEHALSRLPRLVDPVPLAVLGEALVDAVGEPEERELAERGQVARAKVVGERGVDALRG